VLTNLLDNAVKYSPDGGPVQVRLSSDTERIRITVGDRGIGVPPEHRERMFDRFVQAHGERRFGGMGLGLYISRQIVELHGGELRAEHQDEGGTTMVLSLPHAGPAGAQA
jgi:signal transduction histidine kinase